MRELRVELTDRSYPVYVGRGLLERAHELIPPQPRARMIALFLDAGLARSGDRSVAGLRQGLEPLRAEIQTIGDEGERSKSSETLDAAWRWLALSGFHRNDLIVAAGGGARTDSAGFVAATFHRGMPWVVVPTTLLGMVDASIGGKTAINLPQGKNLVGAFHHPVAVVADVDTLATLPDGHMRTGMAEVIKHGLIADRSLLERVTAERDRILARDQDRLEQLIADAAEVKVRIVSEDPEEKGARAFLNYGHTLGHALEVLGGYERFTHGEAVAIGMVFAAELGRVVGYTDLTAEHRDVLREFSLPTGGAGFDYDEVTRAWAYDKKFDAGTRFVVLEELGKPALVEELPEDALRAAYEAVR